MKFRILDIAGGWIAFAVAAVTYISTMEPTSSFWDCGEFIATSYKLQVGHPPGAPLFLMIGRVFSMFASPETAAYWVNMISALSSAFTILFLFWTISALGKKLAQLKGADFTDAKKVAVIGSALVGALAYTFSDTFWFSAVEAEVYAMSSLFTAIVFWAILRWEQVADQDGSNRWLIFIAYMMGLSVGVHLLNLLAIPAIVFVYYFKKHDVSLKGIILAAISSVLLLGFVQKGIIPGVVEMSSYFELAFVNGMGLPFNTGVAVHMILVVAVLVLAIRMTHQENINKGLFGGLVVALTLLVGSFSALSILVALVLGGLIFFVGFERRMANTLLMCLTVILIGYSSYALIMIRSSANPPMDENNPENMFSLLSYLNREQYGSQPLAYGPYFNSPLDNKEPYKDGSPVYVQDFKTGKYIISDEKKSSVPNYADEFKTIFPRMWSTEGRHVNSYKSWSKFEGKPIRYRTVQGENKVLNKPTLSENLRFFFTHQVGWMYWRYFMWNFSGRQNDIQGHGNIIDGNWLSGIGFIDSWRLGPQDNLPPRLKENQALNKYFMLPFILGLLGFIFHYRRDKKDFAIVAMLFFFTGLAIILYLNQYPYQPRERDYAYAGSFYAYCIWIGLGVYGLFAWLSERIKINQMVAGGVITALCLALVPGIMAADGWDDHDRHDRYTARDFAKMYLDSCDKNAVLFTNGDNDTFPLWYVQEVEGYRTDVRVINLSLLNTDWYIDQMKRAAYESQATEFSMTKEMYRQGTRDYVPIVDKNTQGKFIDVKKVIDFISDEKNQVMFSSNRKMNYVPTKKFSLKVDKQKVLDAGFVPVEKRDLIVDEITWEINKNYIMKNDMMILDLLANFNWERPIYFAITTGNDAYIGLQKHFQLEGLAYRLVPYPADSPDGQTGYVYTDKVADKLLNVFEYGGMDKPDVYMDENNRRMCMNLRNNFARTADALMKEGKKDKAQEVLEKCLKVMPAENVPYNYFMLPVAESFYRLGDTEKANQIVEMVYDRYEREVQYYVDLPAYKYKQAGQNPQQSISVMYRVMELVTRKFPQDELGKRVQESFTKYQELFNTKEQQKKRLS